MHPPYDKYEDEYAFDDAVFLPSSEFNDVDTLRAWEEMDSIALAVEACPNLSKLSTKRRHAFIKFIRGLSLEEAKGLKSIILEFGSLENVESATESRLRELDGILGPYARYYWHSVGVVLADLLGEEAPEWW